MSGIYGVLRYDGAPVSADWMERMRTAMACYGPHGGSSRIDGSLGLGHLLLELNPEDAFDVQPVMGRRGPVVSTARLDNRDALLQALQVPSGEAARTSDGQLVSLAFDRWGEEVCSHLQGDWTLAAWDPRERRLLLAKDVFGNTTLYYYRQKNFLAFASSMKALLALPGVSRQADRQRLAQVLLSWQPDAERTAYEGFRRLPWAQAMSVDGEGRTGLREYWTWRNYTPLLLARDEDYEEAFLEHYQRAVASCLRTRKPIAAMLSGGRDSGSMVRLAAPLLAQQGRTLTAYTSVPSFAPDGAGTGKLGDEWEQAGATAAMAGSNLRHVPVDAAGYGIVPGVEHLLEVHDGPSHAAANHFWLQAICETAVAAGAGAILTGAAGNASVSWMGNGSVLLALGQRQHRIAWQLLRHAEPSLWLTLKRQFLRPLLTPALRARRRRELRAQGLPMVSGALRPELSRQLGLEDRMRAEGFDGTAIPSPWSDHHGFHFSSTASVGMGMLSEMGARHGLSFLDPTANQALLQFLLQVPDTQFRRAGKSCWLLRRTFRDLLPQPVLDGRRKGLQAADAGHRVLRESAAVQACLDSLERVPAAQEMLDLPRMRQCLEDLRLRVDPHTTSQATTILIRGLGVGLFLRDLG